MRLRLSFGHTSDELFLVTVGVFESRSYGAEPTFAVTIYDHEDTFLGLVMVADLKDRERFDTVHAVLMTINDPIFPQRWAEVELTVAQIKQLGLNVYGFSGEYEERGRPVWSDHSAALQDFFARIPMPLVILMGSEHRFTFINQSYVDLVRRDAAESLLGRTVRDALPELRGRPFFKLLDMVYQTGQPYVGHEVPSTVRRSGIEEDVLLDFVYHPLRNEAGEVEGIMVQANDVTEQVLARQVSAEREAQMFRQWTELEAIYRTAPVALSLVDARDFRFLRANQRAAQMIGCSVEEVLGQSAVALARGIPGAREVFERAARGENPEGIELEGELPTRPGATRSWSVSAAPIFDASGMVSAITLAATETTLEKQAEERLIESENFVAAELMAESFVRRIAGPVEELKALMAIVRGEIRRGEALEALAVAEAKLSDIAGVTTEAARHYWIRVGGKEDVAVELSA